MISSYFTLFIHCVKRYARFQSQKKVCLITITITITFYCNYYYCGISTTTTNNAITAATNAITTATNTTAAATNTADAAVTIFYYELTLAIFYYYYMLSGPLLVKLIYKRLFVQCTM